MRVKVKGFEPGKSYEVFNEGKKTLLDMQVYFSKKNYVLIAYYDNLAGTEKKYKASKRQLKKFLRLTFPIRIQEIDSEYFFKDFYNKSDGYHYGDWEEWDDHYPCGCCTCCGCSCDDHLYDYEEDETDWDQE